MRIVTAAVIALMWCLPMAACGGSTVSPSATDNNEAGSPSEGTDAGAVATVDCRPRIDSLVHYETRCQYIGSVLPQMGCGRVLDEGPGGAGGVIDITVRKPDSVRIGDPIALGGMDPIVSIDMTFVGPDLIGSLQSSEHGHVVFDEFDVGRILRLELDGVTVQARPDPPFSCAFSQATFTADLGPGVRDQ